MQKVALIIPCYNEEKRLKLANIKTLLTLTDFTIYFANDGSTDGTLHLIELICKEDLNRLKVLNFKNNQGKAGVISASINSISKEEIFDFIGYFDADFSTPVSEIVKMIHTLNNSEIQFIFGSRIQLLNSGIERKWQRHIIGRVIITLINLKFKLGVYDTQCGAKFFSKSLISKIFDKPFQTKWLFDVEIFIRLKRNNLIKYGKEFPIQNWKDIEGSKLSWRSSFKIGKELVYIINKY